MHPIFHVSQLKPSVGEHIVEGSLPPDCFDSDALFVTDRILRTHFVWHGDERVSQFLVAWVDLPLDEVPWVDDVYFHEQFPSFRLDDYTL